MNTSWNMLKLGDSLDLLIDNRGKNPPYVESGIPCISGMSVTDNGLDFSKARYIDEKTWLAWMPQPLQTNDVILTSEAPLGRPALVRTDERIALAQRVYGLRGKKGVLDSRFLYYSLLTRGVQADLLGRATGTTVVGIRQPALKDIKIPSPSFAEQQAIAEVLGALDDKIESNAKLVETLEATFTAHWNALVASKMAHTASVASLVGSPIGGDWGASEATEASNAEVFCIRGADISNLQKASLGNMPRRFLKPSSLNRRRLTDGDLVIEMSGGSPTQSTGRAVLVTAALLKRLELPLSSSNFCKIVRPQNPENTFYLYGLFRDTWHKGEFFPFENGSTGIKNLAFAEYCSSKFVSLPPANELKRFNNLACSLFDGMHAIGAESAHLAETRSALLPQLMSGKLHVQIAEDTVSATL